MNQKDWPKTADLWKFCYFWHFGQEWLSDSLLHRLTARKKYYNRGHIYRDIEYRWRGFGAWHLEYSFGKIDYYLLGIYELELLPITGQAHRRNIDCGKSTNDDLASNPKYPDSSIISSCFGDKRDMPLSRRSYINVELVAQEEAFDIVPSEVGDADGVVKRVEWWDICGLKVIDDVLETGDSGYVVLDEAATACSRCWASKSGRHWIAGPLLHIGWTDLICLVKTVFLMKLLVQSGIVHL